MKKIIKVSPSEMEKQREYTELVRAMFPTENVLREFLKRSATVSPMMWKKQT